MKYVKIRDLNYNEALQQLKREYGDEAIPISHKYVKEGGLFNSRLFAKDIVELTAAVQDKRPAPKSMNTEKRRLDLTVGADKTESLLSALKNTSMNEGISSFAPDSLARAVGSINKNLEAIKRPDDSLSSEQEASPEPISARSAAPDVRIERKKESFEDQINEIRDTLNKIAADKNNYKEERRHELSADESAIMKPFIEILRNNDYDSEERAAMISEFRNSVSREDLKDKFKIEKSFKYLLMSKIVTTGPVKMGNNKKKVLMFVGPTGVGKTTTMAKLGALYSLREGHSVTFITLDNYRIAATEQLKKYAEIMRIPVHAINDQRAFKEAIAKERAEIIMVDTAGRSHRNDLKISEIKSFAEVVDYDFQKFLCVSANTKKKDLSEIFKAFEPVSYNSVIITKVDETSFIGNVVDIADKYNKPISYFTHGQEVPNDITVAEAERLADMMVGNISIS